jgi:hypothetical protein
METRGGLMMDFTSDRVLTTGPLGLLAVGHWREPSLPAAEVEPLVRCQHKQLFVSRRRSRG